MQTSKGTQKRYAACYAQHINPYLGDLPISEIRSSDIQKWVNTLTTKMVSRSGKAKDKNKHPMSPKTILFTVGVIRQIFNICIDEGVIDRSPAKRVTMPKQAPKRQRIMDIEEARSLLESCNGTPLHAPVLLAAVLGLRRSEVMELKWKHMDRRKGTLLVAADGGKTAGSTRVLFLPDSLIEQIDKAGDLDCEFVCSSETGLPLTRTTLDRLWRNHPKKPSGWTFHDLRHGAAGLLYALTKDVEAVQSILGHSKWDMTALYVGRSDKGKKDAIKALSGALFE